MWAGLERVVKYLPNWLFSISDTNLKQYFFSRINGAAMFGSIPRQSSQLPNFLAGLASNLLSGNLIQFHFVRSSRTLVHQIRSAGI